MLNDEFGEGRKRALTRSASGTIRAPLPVSSLAATPHLRRQDGQALSILTMALGLLQLTWKAETSGQGECFVHVRFGSMPQPGEIEVRVPHTTQTSIAVLRDTPLIRTPSPQLLSRIDRGVPPDAE
jgi:hypothetical protein